MSNIYKNYSQMELQDLVEKLQDCLCTQQIKLDDSENLLILSLYHHQGSSSLIGQPIRKYFMLGQYERIPNWMIEKMKKID